MGRYAFVLVSMYRYSRLFIFSGLFFRIEGWVGELYRIQTFLNFCYFVYIYKVPKGSFTIIDIYESVHSVR